jgi:hypothetical protein
MSDRSIRESVQYLAGNHQTDRVTLIDATVNSVDEAARTCECIAVTGSVGNIISGVRLMATLDDGLLVIPAVDSTVVIAMSIFTDPLIVNYSEVEKIVLRGGDLGGLVKVIDLTKKLNALENLLNDLVAKFNIHTHNVTSTAAPTGPSLVQETTVLAPTEQQEIENESITQG